MTADQGSRDIARRRLNQNIVVEAGAGTGKTTLLTDRLLFLLLAGGPKGTGVPLTRIVALTFTDKAAGEIKVRLAERLNDLLTVLTAGSLPDKRRERTAAWLEEARREFLADEDRVRSMAQDALHALDRAPIGTIHHFCSTLLRLFPVEAGLNPNFQIDKGDAFDEIFQDEWGRWLEEELGDHSPRATAWKEILPHVSLSDLAEMARDLCHRPGTAGPYPALVNRLENLMNSLERIPEGKPLLSKQSKIHEAIQRVSDRLRSYGPVAENPLKPLAPSEEKWKKPSSTWPKAWAGWEGETVYQQALKVAETLSPLGEGVIARSRILLNSFIERFRASYRLKGWMGFDDLLTGARDLVVLHPDVRRVLKTRYDAVLVDEFQDTDPLQGEIILFLAERSGREAVGWKDIVLEPGKLFIVGDPKQSIYRFRGADIRAYESFVDMVLRQGGVQCDLQTSFRSHANIVDPVNRLFGDVMTESPGLQPGYLPLFSQPGGRARPGGVELALVEGEEGDDEDPKAHVVRRAEAAWVARWVVEHCGTGDGWGLGDVAILFRSASPLAVYIDAFKDAGIPYLVESDRSFFSTPEVIDFLNLLRVIVNPNDKLSLAGLWRSPLVMGKDRDLPALIKNENLFNDLMLSTNEKEFLSPSINFQQIPPNPPFSKGGTLLENQSFPPFEKGGQGWDFIKDVLAKLREASRQEPLGVFLRRVLRETRFLEATSVAYRGEQTLSNVMKLVRLGEDANAQRGETLVEFVRRLSRSVNKIEDEGESPLGEEHVEAVRFLTIHKAKGLEYRVVILPNLSAAPRATGTKPQAVLHDWSEGVTGHRLISKKWQDLAMIFLMNDERVRLEGEQIRLFYVAATRARDHVILSGAKESKKGSFLSMTRGVSSLQETFWELKGGLKLSVTKIPLTGGEPVHWPHQKKLKSPRLTPELKEAWARRREAFFQVQGQPIFISPSHSPETVKTVSSVSEPVVVGGVLLGRLCHAVLETWDYKNGGDVQAAVDTAWSRLALDGFEKTEELVKPDACKILSNFLVSPPAQAIAQSEILSREAPFLYADRGSVVHGVVDLLTRRDGKLWVTDFKTDAILLGQGPAHALRYQTQGKAYVEAVWKSLGEPCGFDVVFLRTTERVILF